MKFLFLSLMLTISTIVSADETTQIQNKLRLELMESLKLADSQDKSHFEDLSFPAEAEFSYTNNLEFKQIVEVLAVNDVRTNTPQKKGITQPEVNLLVKYFLRLNIDPGEILSPGFQGHLKIPNMKDKSQVIQVLKNIANTRTDMSGYLDYNDVTCFFRNFNDANGPFMPEYKNDDISAEKLNSIKQLDDVTIVGKCHGCGLLDSPEFSKMSAAQKATFKSCKGN